MGFELRSDEFGAVRAICGIYLTGAVLEMNPDIILFYRSFTSYREKKWEQRVDFEAEPDLLLETVYAVRSTVYFGDNNLPTRADQEL
ncbi:hypothetical protein [Serratia rubidaea]|uniref:hypothetical protein n=1 Tax=Serratia rubidaea TaxID=61652 RepID=UPI003FA3A86E